MLHKPAGRALLAFLSLVVVLETAFIGLTGPWRSPNGAPSRDSSPPAAQATATASPNEIPSIERLAPATGFAGTAMLLTVLGVNLDKASTIEINPSQGITLQGRPMPGHLGTSLTVPITIAPDARPGIRTFTVVSGNGTRTYDGDFSEFVISPKSMNALSPDNLAQSPGVRPVVSVVSPTGIASKDPNVLIDGRLESACCGQFDTFDGKNQPTAYFGMEFSAATRVNAFEFQTGAFSPSGGWFLAGSTRLEVKSGDDWLPIRDVYWENGAPEGPASSPGQLAPFSIKSARFPTVIGTGIRISGVPASGSGTAAYVSSGEVRAYFKQTETPGSADWTMYRYDLTHTGQNPNATGIDKSNVTRLKEKWSASLTPGAIITQSGVFATPVVSDGLVYAGTMNGWVYALSLETGKEVWKRFTSLRTENPLGENGVVATPAISGDTLYVAGDDASFWALDAKTGEVRWHTPLAIERYDAGYASPMVVGDRLIVAVANGMSDQPCSVGRVAALNLADGRVLWTTSMTLPDRPGAGVWATPAVDIQKNMIYAATGNTCFPSNAPAESLNYDSIVGLDLTTGSIKWVHRHLVGDFDDLDFGSSPVMFEDRVAAVSKNGWLVAVDQLSGALSWQTVIATQNATPYDGGGVNSPSYADGRIYTGGGPINGPPDSQAINYRGSFLAVDPIDGHVIWRQPLASAPLGASAVINGMVFVGDGSSLVAFDGATGQLLHRIANPTRVWGGVAIARGCVLVGDLGGVVHCYTIDGR